MIKVKQKNSPGRSLDRPCGRSKPPGLQTSMPLTYPARNGLSLSAIPCTAKGATLMKHPVAVLFSVFVLMLSIGHAQSQQPPATLRSILLHELHTTHNQADWFVPISTAVDGLTAEQASWQPPAGVHSAGQLTYHLLFWNR